MKIITKILLFILIISLFFFFIGKNTILYIQKQLKTEMDIHYNIIMNVLIFQVENTKKDNILILKKSIDKMLFNDPFLLRIIFLDQSNHVLLKREKNNGTTGKIYSQTISKSGDILGVLQLVLDKDKIKKYFRKISNKIILYFFILYGVIIFLFIYWYYELFVNIKNKLINIFSKDMSPENIEKIQFPYEFKLLKNAIKNMLLRYYNKLQEKEFIHPITGLYSYYYVYHEINKKLEEKTSDCLLIIKFKGLINLKENYGLLKYYEFLERVSNEIQQKVKIIQNNALIGHMEDNTLIMDIKKENHKIICEKIITIFHNLSNELIKEFVFLKKGWAKAVIFVFTDKELNNCDVENIEKKFNMFLRRFSTKSNNHIAYLCKKESANIIMEL